MIDPIFKFLSAEFFLVKCANSGPVVLLRTVFISVILYVIAIGIRSWTSDGAVLSFFSLQMKKEISETLPWFGGIFAGVYAALYSRFSSQWNYLASFYNQLMHTLVTTNFTEQRNKDHLVAWQAGFVEDAYDLHLACKPMFSPFIKQLLNDCEVRKAFQENSTNGMKKFLRLKSLLKIYP